jgi:hypothetical protein
MNGETKELLNEAGDQNYKWFRNFSVGTTFKLPLFYRAKVPV